MSLNMRVVFFTDEVRRKENHNCEIYNKVYARLIRECTMLGKEGEFNICFMELQQDFLWKRPCELKNLICLVKHWYQLVRHPTQILWTLCVESGIQAREEV